MILEDWEAAGDGGTALQSELRRHFGLPRPAVEHRALDDVRVLAALLPRILDAASIDSLDALLASISRSYLGSFGDLASGALPSPPARARQLAASEAGAGSFLYNCADHMLNSSLAALRDQQLLSSLEGRLGNRQQSFLRLMWTSTSYCIHIL